METAHCQACRGPAGAGGSGSGTPGSAIGSGATDSGCCSCTIGDHGLTLCPDGSRPMLPLSGRTCCVGVATTTVGVGPGVANQSEVPLSVGSLGLMPDGTGATEFPCACTASVCQPLLILVKHACSARHTILHLASATPGATTRSSTPAAHPSLNAGGATHSSTSCPQRVRPPNSHVCG